LSKAYSITYDLMSPGRDYATLFERIKRLGTWARPTASQWVVLTTGSAAGIRDGLRPFIDANDRLLVTALTGEAAWSGLTPDVSEWLRRELTRASQIPVR